MSEETSKLEDARKSLPWDDAKATPLADIQKMSQAIKDGLAKASMTPLAATAEIYPSDLQDQLSILEADLNEQAAEIERIDAFGTMTQRAAIAALLVQCGAKPKDLNEITKLWMETIPKKPMGETSMEELYQTADDAVTKFYADKQQS